MAKRNAHLDMARGLAALAVAFGHARAFFFVDFSSVASPGLFSKLFYFLTGLGHQAVVVFFVLSGYFIGGAVANSAEEGRWSWKRYGINRLCRLWVVLLPALVLTLFWDKLGGYVADGRGYNGSFMGLIHSGPEVAEDGGAWAFLRNLFFLQTITGPAFGSNRPLWSLAYEFWYYLLFPLAYMAVAPVNALRAKRVLYLIIFCVILILLPNALIFSGLIWCIGFGANRVIARFFGVYAIMKRRLFFGVSMLCFFYLLSLSRLGTLPNSDLWLGLAFACTVPYLVSHDDIPRWYEKVAARLSNISYTLYLTHFPLLTFYFYSFRLPYRSPESPSAFLGYALVCAVTLAYASAVWWLFEKRTDWFKTRATAFTSAWSRPDATPR